MKGRGLATRMYVWKTIRVNLQETTPISLWHLARSRRAVINGILTARGKKLVQSAIVTVLDKQEFLTTTIRAVTAKSRKTSAKFAWKQLYTNNNFSDYLVGTLRKNFQRLGKYQSRATSESICGELPINNQWKSYHQSGKNCTAP